MREVSKVTRIRVAVLAIVTVFSVASWPYLAQRAGHVDIDLDQSGIAKPVAEKRTEPAEQSASTATSTQETNTDVLAPNAGANGVELDPADPDEVADEEARQAAILATDGESANQDRNQTDQVTDREDSAPKPPRIRPSPDRAKSREPLCFFYDRPPRTGSTTISRALKRCLSGRGYEQPDGGPRSERPYHVANMMKLQDDRIGVFDRHLYINANDVAGMRKRCGRLLYVTSCRPMRQRMWSAIKRRFISRSGDSVLSSEAKQDALRVLMRDRRTERFLEHYPYLSPDAESLELGEGEKLVPDYIIRTESLQHDLGKLLTALQCSTDYENVNMHTEESWSATDVQAVELKELKMRDATYVRLMKLAKEENENGLIKARAFQ